MTTVAFSKKEISEILKNDFSKEINDFKSKNRKYKCFFSTGAECFSMKTLVDFFKGHEGNYFTLNCEMKDEFKSLLS